MFGRKKPNPVIDHAKLGREIEKVFVADYIFYLSSTKRQIWSAFVRGGFTGLGGVVGATFGVALLLTILHFLGGAPFIGHYVRDIADSISQSRR